MTKTNPVSGNKLLDNEVVRFIFSSGSGFVVDIAAYYVFYHFVFKQKLYSVMGFTVRNVTLSLAVSFVLGVLVNFLITKFLVFAKSKTSSTKQFFRFVGVAIVGFYANLELLKGFVNFLNIDPPVARPLAALSLFFASYFVHKFFSFSLSLRHHHATSGNSNPSN